MYDGPINQLGIALDLVAEPHFDCMPNLPMVWSFLSNSQTALTWFDYDPFSY